MAPIAISSPDETPTLDVSALKAQLSKISSVNLPPENTLRRYQRAGIDLSGGYPYYPPKPEFVEDVKKIRDEESLRAYVDPGTRADPEKKALFGAAKEVRDLTTHIGVSAPARQGNTLTPQTEIVGLQLKDLTDQQKDELALLVAERSVVCE